MALDAGIGLSTSNSYNTRAEFDAYLLERPNVPASVTASTGPQRDAALMQATGLFDANVCILGVRTTLNQALLFPRTGLLNRNGDPVDPAVIPYAVKYVTNELARLLLVSDLTLQSSASAKGVIEMKAGPVAFKFDKAKEWSALSPALLAYIPKSWLCPTAVAEAQVPILEVI